MKEVIAGVPLAQYAAVTAALAEAFPLRAVLTVEGLALSQWAEADRGWTDQLDKDPSLLALYEAELTAARERLLSREEPAEGDKATAPLRAGKAKLVRSGTGLSPLLAMSNAAAGVSDVHVHAPAPALMPMMPSGLAVEPPLPLHVVPPAFAPEPPPAMVPMPPSALGDPRSGPAPRFDDGFTMVGMQVSSAVLPFRAAAELGAESADGDPHMETVAVRVPASSALPFGGSAQQAPAPSAPVLYGTPFKAASQAAPSPAPSAPSLYGTPFKAASPSPAPSTPSAEQPAWEEDEHKETAAIRLPAASALPFQRAEAAPAPAPSAPSLYGTPFKAASHAAPSPPAPAAEPRAWSHAAALEPEEYSQDEWGVAPPARSPRIMPLEQHASLCLEIALDPARAGEIMARYGVTDAEKAVSDEHYRARIAAEPEIGAQWHRAYAAYHAWLTSRPPA